MKKTIPAPIKESLKFKAINQALSTSSTSGKKVTWNENLKRNIKIEAPTAQKHYKDDNHTPGNRSKEEKASGMGTIIRGNHPRRGDVVSNAEAEGNL